MTRRFAAGALLLLACAPARAPNPGPEWVPLGNRVVSDRIDHDLIPVTGARGDFRRIKLTVGRGAVDFHRVVVHYGNGRGQEIELRNTIPAGGQTRAIDLIGGDRIIRSVEFWYDARTLGSRAIVHLYGLP